MVLEGSLGTKCNALHPVTQMFWLSLVQMHCADLRARMKERKKEKKEKKER